MLTLIAARARNGAIGKDGQIPWRLPEDLRMFQRETLGGAVIMGRKTWESLPKRPLEGRLNCVITRQKGLAEHSFSSIAAAISASRDAGYHRIYGIGGQAIYAEMLPFAERLLLTEVGLDIDAPDARFPDFDESQWREVHTGTLRADGPHARLRELIRR
ncbi:MAG: dihydrofolate reductase [Paracoccus sp. (in: a-proteobacteria)]|nr:dihydrofolate reductase [Paracoccus sp. (in: a-proteobacteria)]